MNSMVRARMIRNRRCWLQWSPERHLFCHRNFITGSNISYVEMRGGMNVLHEFLVVKFVFGKAVTHPATKLGYYTHSEICQTIIACVFMKRLLQRNDYVHYKYRQDSMLVLKLSKSPLTMPQNAKCDHASWNLLVTPKFERP